MSNQNGQGSSQVHQYKKIVSKPGTIIPDAPDGEYELTVARGKSQIKPNKNGDPMVSFQVRLDEAAEPENEFAQGTLLWARLTFVSDTDPTVKAFMKNRYKKEQNDFCAAFGLDLDIIPEEMNDPETELLPLIAAVEGKSTTGFVVNEKSQGGDIFTKVAFAQPKKAALATNVSGREDD